MKSNGVSGGLKIIIQVSYGELLDKITILEIKAQKCSNSEQLMNINYELQLLQKVHLDNYIGETVQLMEQLRIINLRLWYLEDQIRLLGDKKDFGQEFICVARDIYTNNDQRARIKRAINQIANSKIIEEKYYS